MHGNVTVATSFDANGFISGMTQSPTAGFSGLNWAGWNT
jgi:hypothetical protein